MSGGPKTNPWVDRIAPNQRNGAVIGGALGALSGARKRKGETNVNRIRRMVRRGAAGATIGYVAPAAYKDIAEGRKRRLTGTHVPLSNREKNQIFDFDTLNGAIGGAVLGGASGGILGASEEAVKSNKNERKRDKARRILRGGIKGTIQGNIRGGAVGAAIGAASNLPVVYRGK